MRGLYLNDAFTLEDGLGTTVAGDQVARMALQVDTPFTLGVTGKWGAGKTSVLRRAFVTLGGNPLAQSVLLGEEKRENLEGFGHWHFRSGLRRPRLDLGVELEQTADNSLCVWFSPWQHQGAANPLVALLLEVRAQYAARLTSGKKAREKISEVVRRGMLAALPLLDRVIDSALALQLGGVVNLPEGTTESVRRAWRESAPEEPTLGDGQRFHLLFEDAVETLLAGLEREEAELVEAPNAEARLVVFVDDLDRCEEGIIVQLLEAIKLYLGSPRCVFILAIDESAVLAALGNHWPGRSEDANREYLEKLFQAIVPVPSPRTAAVCAVLAKQLRLHQFPDPEGTAVFLAELIEPNPRKIKNFVNSACACWGMLRSAGALKFENSGLAASESSSSEGAGEKVEPADVRFARRFLLMQYLRSQHKAVWRLLERQPWAIRFLALVLSDSPDQLAPNIEGISAADQRMLVHLLFRAFAHVRKDDRQDPDRHGHIPIGDAVELLNQRIDRKRSDECFKRCFLEYFADQMDLDETLLSLPEVPAGG